MLDTLSHQYPFLKIENIVQQYMDAPTTLDRDYTGLGSGIKRLDEFTGGFYPGELVVVSGYRSMGQEAFLEALAINVACKQKRPVAYFSLGRKRWMLAERLLAKMAGVDPCRLATGHLRKEDEEKIKTAQNNFQEIPLYINDSNGITAHEIHRHLDECLGGEYGVKPDLVIVDCLQLIQSWGEKVPRKDEIDDILYELVEVARSINAPLVLHSLLYPDCREFRVYSDYQKPILADLLCSPETTMIDKHADTVLFFHQKGPYLSEGAPEPEGRIEVIAEKLRNGRGGGYLFFEHVDF